MKKIMTMVVALACATMVSAQNVNTQQDCCKQKTEKKCDKKDGDCCKKAEKQGDCCSKMNAEKKQGDCCKKAAEQKQCKDCKKHQKADAKTGATKKK